MAARPGSGISCDAAKNSSLRAILSVRKEEKKKVYLDGLLDFVLDLLEGVGPHQLDGRGGDDVGADRVLVVFVETLGRRV